MRDLTLSNWGYNHRTSHNDVPQRLTSSCPSLCPFISPEIVPRSSNNDIGSDPDLLANCSTNSSPTHFPPVGPRSQNAQGIDRRRSWTDLEDTRFGRRRYSGQNHLQAQNMVNIVRYIFKEIHYSLYTYSMNIIALLLFQFTLSKLLITLFIIIFNVLTITISATAQY